MSLSGGGGERNYDVSIEGVKAIATDSINKLTLSIVVRGAGPAHVLLGSVAPMRDGRGYVESGLLYMGIRPL